MKNPYAEAPKRQFWETGVAEAARPVPADFYTPKWPIARETKVATAGSCFAQHIGRRMAAAGIPVMDVEPAPTLLPKSAHMNFGYGIYSARYGNIYTVRQLLQLAEEAFGDRPMSELIWRRGERFVDALRPTLEPEGFTSPEIVLAHRRRHLDRVRSMFVDMDLFIFTLGLTESWEDIEAGRLLPVVPGTRAGGVFDPSRHVFRNQSFADTVDDFLSFRELINKHRPRAPALFLLTVSPVPLVATARDAHVQVSTVYSKSVLRAAAGELTISYDDIDYFPSYEIITSPWSGKCFFESDMRSVRAEGVENVMRTFMGSHGLAHESPARPTAVIAEREAEVQPDDMAVACDEELLRDFSQ